MEIEIKRRNRIVNQLQNLYKYTTDKLDDNTSINSIKSRLEILNETYKSFNEMENELLQYEKYESIQEKVDDWYYEARSKFEDALDKRMVQTEQLQQSNLNETLTEFLNHQKTFYASVNGSNVKLPKLNIEPFAGEYELWPSFKDLFVTAVHSSTKLSGSIKLQLLKGLVRGEAADLIRHITTTDQNYSQAWEKLDKRYNKPKPIISKLVKEFLEQKPVTSPNHKELRKLYNRSDEIIRSLRSIDGRAESRDVWLIHLLLCKMDDDTKQLWARDSVTKEFPTFDEFLDFLNERCDALESCTININKLSKASTSKSFFTKENSTNQQPRIACSICNDSHLLYKCPLFRNKSLTDRLDFVKKQNLCINCLRNGHFASKCPYRTSCLTCRKKHHTLLHQEKTNQSRVHHHIIEQDEISESKPSTSSMFCQLNRHTVNSMPTNAMREVPTILHDPIMPSNNSTTNPLQFSQAYMQNVTVSNILPTAIVKVQSRRGNEMLARILLDSGSQSNFITESFVKQLGLAREKSNIEIYGLGSVSNGNTRGKARVIIRSRIDPHYIIHADVLIVNSIASKLPTSTINLDCNDIDALQLADPQFYKPNSIDILLGIEFFFDVIEAEKLPLPNFPPLCKSKFGWLTAGSISAADNPVKCFSAVTETKNEFDHDRLNQLLQKFWEVENVPTKRFLTEDERICEKYFNETTTITNEGRFQVRLPFRSSDLKLGDSYNNAKRRLFAMETRFRSNPELHQQYCTFMREYITMNHMKMTSEQAIEKDDNKRFYIPHHAIFKESTTTHLRVVFDASCKSSTGISLNDIMYTGPKLQSDLISILLRFRQYKFVFVSDVEKMYRQILVHPADNNYQLILWRENPKQQIQTYQLSTVTYGMNCSPYLAMRCLKQIADENRKQYPRAAQVISDGFYMDDALFGADTEEEAIEIKNDVVKLLNERGLHLRKWRANSNSLLSSFNKNEIEFNPKMIEEDTSAKTLGMVWNSDVDTFSYRVKLNDLIHTWTKRRVLSEVSRVYDPMGCVSPSIMIFKIMLQKFWVLKLEWDTPLPIDLQNEFKIAYGQLNQLNRIEISRWYYSVDNVQTIQFHAFCDASEKAFGCVVYVRVVNQNGDIFRNFVYAKGRVAPIQQVSLPRLELCGAHLLAKSVKYLNEELNPDMKIKFFAWTDAKTVLRWLSDLPRRWKNFVANRTSYILNIIPRQCWNYVPSKQNPADMITRGVLPEKLCAEEMWFKGPSWLRLSKEHWPQDVYIPEEADTNVLERKTRVLTTVTEPDQRVKSWIEILSENCSSWLKMKIVVVYVLRFINRSKSIKNQYVCKKGPIQTEELQRAEVCIIKLIQSQYFQHEILDLEKLNHIHRKSSLLSLDPVLDEKGVLRVGGRLNNSALAYSSKHPMILPKNHPVNQLIIRQLHAELLHGGTTLVLNTLRQRYWMICARQTVKSVLRQCVVCIRYRGQTMQPKMGDLPQERVTQFRPFLNCGLDYAGPVMIKTSKKRNAPLEKAYIAVFVCLSVKAVHLEIVTSMNTDSFIAALRRLVGRRGVPEKIWCDNGSNFIGGSAELKLLHNQFLYQCRSKEVSSYCLQKCIQFKFIPPISPNFGGLWESVVRSTKFHLKRVMMGTQLTYEELTTLIIQIESILNSRPLCRLNDDVNESQILTPSHFLIGENITAIPEPNLLHIPEGKLNKWQNIQQRVQGFWKSWQHDYLHTLQTKFKWQFDYSDMREGDVVIIRESNLQPHNWLLGRVLKLYPGKDGITRVVKLKTSTSELMRPVNKLIKLPVRDQRCIFNAPEELQDQRMIV